MRTQTFVLVATATIVLATCSLVALVTALLVFTPKVSAANSKVIPCVVGNGNDGLCDSCDKSKAIEVTSWDKATWVRNFSMGNAPSDTGPGYKVFWKIEQPSENCRVLLFDEFNSDKGSIDPRLSGRIKLSVNKGGCYMSTIRSSGVGVGACCGPDCVNIGAYPGSSSTKRDTVLRRISKAKPFEIPAGTTHLPIKGNPDYGRTQARKRTDVEHSMQTSSTKKSHNSRTIHVRDKTTSTFDTSPLKSRNQLRAGRELFQRDIIGQNPNPWAGGPGSSQPSWNCNATPNGGTYTKSGKQVVDGNSFPCGSDLGCDMSVDFQASVSSSVSSEKTTTYTNSLGVTVEATVGWMMSGPTATVSTSINREFSDSVATSTGTSNTDTKSRGISFRVQVTPGFQYNSWWAPTLICRSWTLSCNKGQGPVEKCDPLLDSTGKPVGEQGVMTTGHA